MDSPTKTPTLKGLNAEEANCIVKFSPFRTGYKVVVVPPVPCSLHEHSTDGYAH